MKSWQKGYPHGTWTYWIGTTCFVVIGLCIIAAIGLKLLAAYYG
jgi:hypothetical protein